MDREKVIKGLGCCKYGYCPICPYYDTALGGGCDMYDDALAILKEQEPLKPHKSDAYASMWLCGACNGVVALKEPYSEDWYISCEYCPHCGRKVKWDG